MGRRMPSILMLQGQAQYGVANYFVAALAQQLRHTGQLDVVELSLSHFTSVADVVTRLQQHPVDIVFSVNAIGAEIISAMPTAQRPRFISWLLDHPVYHFSRLMLAKPTVLCVDNLHVEFCQRLGLSAHFFPHATDIQMQPPAALADKKGILFAASAADDTVLLSQLVQQAPDIARLLTDPATQDLYDVIEQLRINTAADVVLQQQSVISLLLLCDNLLRARQRNRLVRECAEQNIALTIVGNGWHTSQQYQQHCYLPAQPFSQLLTLISQSRFVLHHNPGFRQGLHERIVYGLQQGTQVLCPAQPFFQHKYGQGYGVQLFNQVEHIASLLQLSEVDYLEQLQQGQQHTQTYDTWRKRAQTLLELCFMPLASENRYFYV